MKNLIAFVFFFLALSSALVSQEASPGGTGQSPRTMFLSSLDSLEKDLSDLKALNAELLKSSQADKTQLQSLEDLSTSISLRNKILESSVGPLVWTAVISTVLLAVNIAVDIWILSTKSYI